jgi:hypothetical protein
MLLGLDPDDPRVQSATFAQVVADFWRSDIGVYLKNCAQQECDQATKQLVENVDQMTREEILAAQARVWRASMFCEWLERAYYQGMCDLNILEEETDAARG